MAKDVPRPEAKIADQFTDVIKVRLSGHCKVHVSANCIREWQSYASSCTLPDLNSLPAVWHQHPASAEHSGGPPSPAPVVQLSHSLTCCHPRGRPPAHIPDNHGSNLQHEPLHLSHCTRARAAPLPFRGTLQRQLMLQALLLSSLLLCCQTFATLKALMGAAYALRTTWAGCSTMKLPQIGKQEHLLCQHAGPQVVGEHAAF